MLKLLTGVSLGLISTCSVNPGLVHYCDGPNRSRFSIDFDGKVITFTSGGMSDQLSPIIPCSDRIETCFLGEISFVHPFRSAVSLNSNLVSAERVGAEAFRVTTRGGGTQTSYSIEKGRRLPREFRLTNLISRETGTYVRCWRPLSLV